MNIKSNINRDYHKHDNVNFLPIEKQVFNELSKDEFFAPVEYVVFYKGGCGFSHTNSVGYFRCNSNFILSLEWTNQPKEYTLIFDPCFKDGDNYILKFTYPFNKEVSLDEMKAEISPIMENINKLNDINAWGKENIEKTHKAVMDYIIPFFEDTPELTPSYDTLPENITSGSVSHICLKFEDPFKQSKDDNKITHRWFNIIKGKIVPDKVELEYLFNLKYGSFDIDKIREIQRLYDNLLEKFKKIDFYQIPEFVEWEKKKKKALPLLENLPDRKKR